MLPYFSMLFVPLCWFLFIGWISCSYQFYRVTFIVKDSFGIVSQEVGWICCGGFCSKQMLSCSVHEPSLGVINISDVCKCLSCLGCRSCGIALPAGMQLPQTCMFTGSSECNAHSCGYGTPTSFCGLCECEVNPMDPDGCKSVYPVAQ